MMAWGSLCVALLLAYDGFMPVASVDVDLGFNRKITDVAPMLNNSTANNAVINLKVKDYFFTDSSGQQVGHLLKVFGLKVEGNG